MLVVSHNINFTNNLNIDRMLYMQTGEICYYDKEKVKEEFVSAISSMAQELK